jgi:hypothetical protein
MSDEMSDENLANITEIHQLADLLCRFPGRGRQHMAVNVHGSGNVFVAQTLLCDFHINALQKHDRGAQMAQVVETAPGQTAAILQFG